MKVTVFQFYNSETKKWEHHHIEDGWHRKPVPISDLQKTSWKKTIFWSWFRYLKNGKIMCTISSVL